MSRIINKPHLIFSLSIPIIMIIGIISGEAVLDINVLNTYFVISYIHLTTLISIFFGIIGLGYWIMLKANRKLSKWLNWTHIGLTFGGTIIILILVQFYRKELMEYEFNNNLNLIIMLIILFMILGQIIFPINIIYGLIKNKKTSG